MISCTAESTRQIFVLDLQMVYTSCGYAVPYYEFQGERPTLLNWTENKSDDELTEYWQEKNTLSLDGRDTGLFSDPQD